MTLNFLFGTSVKFQFDICVFLDMSLAKMKFEQQKME